MAEYGAFGLLGPSTVPLLEGDYQGLAVMEAYSSEPIIITTEKVHSFLVIILIGISICFDFLSS